MRNPFKTYIERPSSPFLMVFFLFVHGITFIMLIHPSWVMAILNLGKERLHPFHLWDVKQQHSVCDNNVQFEYEVL